jgi:hypothetical protein
MSVEHTLPLTADAVCDQVDSTPWVPRASSTSRRRFT